MQSKTIYVTGVQLVYLRSAGVLELLPDISAEEIDDKNKSNSLLRVLALLQTLWLVIQVIARHMEKLLITQLGTVTLAFAALSILTRAISWQKPKDIRTTTLVQATRLLTEEEQSFVIIDDVDDDRYEDILFPGTSTIFSVIGLLFGGLHCLAWNEEFPAAVEKTLRRVASLVTMLLPLSLNLRYVVYFDTRIKLWDWMLKVLFVLYTLSRLVILAETGRTLFFQPPDTFKATWTVNLPHLG